jgi:hypothetical protein
MDEINRRAQDKFSSLKTKLKLDLVKQSLHVAKNDVDLERLEKMFNEGKKEEVLKEVAENLQVANSKMEFVDASFDFIESLQLPPKLSLAIGLIVSGHKSNNPEDYNNARIAIKEHLMAIGYGMREN